jgi:EAL domain-containing protein (putative c-di-GMP-specific phosphodiesterase class I)
MNKQKIHCVIIDRNAEMTAFLDAALRSIKRPVQLHAAVTLPQMVSLLKDLKPHILFCPYIRDEHSSRKLIDVLQKYSLDTLLVWLTEDQWQGLTHWLLGVEFCILPTNDIDYFRNYIDFLIRYATIKSNFRQCKKLLHISEIRCHWLVDYSWEPIAYIAKGMHLYANYAYLSLLGFNSVKHAQSVALEQIIDEEEQAIFTTLSSLAMMVNEPSNRLLTTLITLDGQKLRADIRFIPAVLKGRRCIQLHVRPVEQGKTPLSPVLLSGKTPWDQLPKPTTSQLEPLTTTSIRSTIAPSKSESASEVHLPIVGMKAHFNQLIKLKASMPDLYLAEPIFQSGGGVTADYGTLTNKLSTSLGRFRLDYWNIAQALAKLKQTRVKGDSIVCFVALGEAIFTNETLLIQLINFLIKQKDDTPYLILGLASTYCARYTQFIPRLLKLLRQTQVQVALNQLELDNNALKLIDIVKPDFIFLEPNTLEKIRKQAKNAQQFQLWLKQLDTNTQLIVSEVNDIKALRFLKHAGVTYLNGNIKALQAVS